MAVLYGNIGVLAPHSCGVPRAANAPLAQVVIGITAARVALTAAAILP
jgi:hypothetical protein